jgi:hypothetical protein
MLTTAAAIMMIVWPGHDIPPQPYPSYAVCERAVDQLRHAGHDLFQSVPGFRVWCVLDGEDWVS